MVTNSSSSSQIPTHIPSTLYPTDVPTEAVLGLQPSTPYPANVPTSLFPTLSSSLYPTPSHTTDDFVLFHNRACRTIHGDDPISSSERTATTTNEYILPEHVFRDTCENECRRSDR